MAAPVPPAQPQQPDDIGVAIILDYIINTSDRRTEGLRFLFKVLRKTQPQSIAGVTAEVLAACPWGDVLRAKSDLSPQTLLVISENLRNHFLQPAKPTSDSFVMDTSSPLGNVARRIVLSLQKASFAKLCDLVQGFRRAIGNTKAEFLPSQLEQVIHLMAHDVLPAMLSSPKLSDTFAVLKGPTVPAVSASVRWHFIQALEAVERADVPKAIEALYSYFDCFGPIYGTGDATQKAIVHVGFSSLAIAAFLLRLRSDDAIPALHESVRLGLERGDSYLIALALYRLLTAALDSGLLRVPYALLSQLLTQAGVLAARRPPGTVPPPSAAEHAVLHTLTRTSMQLQWPELSSLQEALATLTETASRLALPASAPPHDATRAILSHQRRSLRAAVWARAGSAVLAETYWNASLPPNVHLPALHRTAVESELLQWEAAHGKLSTALDAARTRLVGISTGLPAFEGATRCALQLATETALAQRSYGDAKCFAAQLRAFTPAEVLPNEYLHARQLEARAHLHRDQPAVAAAIYTRAEAAVRTHWPHRGDLRLSLALFSLELATAYARTGHPTAALPMVLHALAAAETTQVRGPLHTEAVLALAEVMLLLDIKARCRAFVEDALPQALQHGGHRIIACTWLTLARATLAEGATPAALQAALQQLDRALASAALASEDDIRADVHYLRARVLHQLGREQERNEAARLFRLATEARAQSETTSCYSNIRALPEQLGALAEKLRARGA